MLRFHALDIARAVENRIGWVAADRFGTHGRLRFPARAKVADELSHLAERVPVAHRHVTEIIDGPGGLLRHGPAGAVGAHG